MLGRYNQLGQYRRDSAHKSRADWAVISLGFYMSERQHIYEDLNESSSASPGGSQQLEIPLSPNSKRAANIFHWNFSRRGDFNASQDSIGRLYFCQTPTFCIPANILGGAYILYIRQYFGYPPIFSWDANILYSRQYFGGRQYFMDLLDFVTANICTYFQYLFCASKFATIFLAQLFWP